MQAPGDDFAVALDRNLPAGERHLLDQHADRQGLLEALGGAVHRYLYHWAILPLALLLASGGAFAAGAAYQVDTAELSEAGSCKLEAWYSRSAARDEIAAVNPACVVDVSRPVEIGAQFARGRSDGESSTTLTPKLKSNFIPSAIGKPGVAVTMGATYDASDNRASSLFVALPATLRLSNLARINLDLGWLRDRGTGADHATYGAGLDLRTGDNIWTLTAEVFGQAVKPAAVGENQPRYQLGMRYRPVDPFNIDLIYGRNLIGEGRDWLTLSVTARFR